jgi:hypothetical protein
MRPIACLAVLLLSGSAWATEPTRLRVVGRWVAPSPAGSERMCTNVPTEHPGGYFEGQIAYMADGPGSGLVPLYRRFWAAGGDHMETLSSTEGSPSYVSEGIQGYVWQAPPPGAAKLNRWYRPAPYDHATHNENEVPPTGYTLEGQMGWAFPRYGLTTEAFLPLAAGEVAIKSNWIAGGVVWDWTQGGFEYVNDADYGRSIQAAMWLDTSNFLDAINPTEAGDRFAGSGSTPGWWHGSPIITAGNDVPTSTQITAAVPLQWDPTRISGGDPDHPYAWLGYKLGKEIQLNFNNGVSNMPRVAKYVTTVTLGEGQDDVLMEAPSLYAVAELNRYFVYDLSTDKATEMFMVECSYLDNRWRYDFHTCADLPPADRAHPCWTNAGAAILASADLTHAIGIYGRHPSAGGSVNFFGLVDGSTWPVINGACGPGTGQTGWQFSLVDAMVGYIDHLPAGDSRYTTYIASGTLAQVKTDFRTLFQRGF